MSETKFSKSPLSWVVTAYFAEGLPYIAIAAASALMFKNMGISDTQIAIWTSLIMWPYTFKPLWGPFLEIYRTKKFFVILTQLTIGVLFGLVGFSLSLPNFFIYAIVLLAIIAFSGATHDMAVDGVYLNTLSPKEQAKYIGWQGRSLTRKPKWYSQGIDDKLIYLTNNTSSTVVLVVDIISAINVGKQPISCCCLFGSNPTLSRMQALSLIGKDKFILWLDKDKEFESLKKSAGFRYLGFNCYSLTTYKDPKYYSQENIQILLANYK